MGRLTMGSFCGKLRVDAKRNSVTRKDGLRAEKSGVQCRAYSPDPRLHHTSAVFPPARCPRTIAMICFEP